MKTRLVSFALAATLLGSAAQAQTPVYDATAAAKLLQQYETAVQQLEQLRAQVQQGQNLFTSLNAGSSVNSLAPELSSPALRAFLPDAQALGAAPSANSSTLGALGSAAAAIRSANRIYTPPPGDPIGQELEASGNRAAIGAALGQQVADISAQRLLGLQALQGSIGTGDARSALDLQARLQAEQAMLINEQIRLQGIALQQTAQDRLLEQRERERAAQSQDQASQLFKSMRQ